MLEVNRQRKQQLLETLILLHAAQDAWGADPHLWQLAIDAIRAEVRIVEHALTFVRYPRTRV